MGRMLTARESSLLYGRVGNHLGAVAWLLVAAGLGLLTGFGLGSVGVVGTAVCELLLKVLR